MKSFIAFGVGIIIGISIYHYILINAVIDRRAQDLGMMHYSIKDGGMVANPDNEWTLQYLKHGHMK